MGGWFWRVPVAALALSLAACQTLTAGSPESEKAEVVTARANARWAAIVARRFDDAYDYLSPASRASITRRGFETIVSRLAYREASVTRVSCRGAVCNVQLELVYDTKMMKGVRTPINESWIIEKGQAWYVWPVS